MPKNVQIRDMPDETYDTLRSRAAAEGLGLPEYLRRELTKMAGRLSPDEALRRQRALVEASGKGPTRQQILDVMDEIRGPWPSS